MTRRTAAGMFLLLVLLLGPFFQGGCTSPSGPQDSLARPPETGDGWPTASLESVGMALGPMEALVDLMDETPNHRFHSLLIVKDGTLVFEAYWPGTDLVPETLEPVARDFRRETLHYVASVSKSVTSALLGIAMDQGHVGTVDDLLFTYFPDYESYRTAENGEVKLRHLLSFSSGYDWSEGVYGFGDPRDSHYQMFRSQDPVAYLLGRDMAGAPGAEFHYNSGDTNLVGEIIRRSSPSATLVDFAREHLFEPLGIQDFRWVTFSQAPSMAFASGGVSLRPRDMAKLGQLFLDGGVWNGARVVPSQWVQASTAREVPLVGYGSLTGYGFNWWLGSLPFQGGSTDLFSARGWGGQEVVVFPEIHLVVVVTGGRYYEDGPVTLGRVLRDYVLVSAEGL